MAQFRGARNFRGGSVVCRAMKPECDLMDAEAGQLDRRIIRVEMPAAHAGIMAALRRAFEAAASEPCDRDFTELLRRLN
jgi:hypothetical protein